MNSFDVRNDFCFMRNSFEGQGKWNIPLIRRQEVNLSGLELLPYSKTKLGDNEANCRKGVHFFLDDYRFKVVYSKPASVIKKIRQYAFLLSPDFSVYSDMGLWKQIACVGKNRWCGAYWQSLGFKVIPTISWSTYGSYEFCFDGVEQGSIVAVSMNGSKKNNFIGFMRGYNEMLNKIKPSKIIVLGKPFSEMQGDILAVDYVYPRGRVI